MCNYDRGDATWKACPAFKKSLEALLDGRRTCYLLKSLGNEIVTTVRKNGMLIEGYEQRDRRVLQPDIDSEKAAQRAETASPREGSS